jgi:hypothetical protein
VRNFMCAQGKPIALSGAPIPRVDCLKTIPSVARVSPKEIATAVLFLASDDASFCDRYRQTNRPLQPLVINIPEQGMVDPRRRGPLAGA